MLKQYKVNFSQDTDNVSEKHSTNGTKLVKTFKDACEFIKKKRADRRKNVSCVNRSIVYKDTITGHFPLVLKKKKKYILSFNSLSYSTFGWNDKTLKDMLGVLSEHKLPEYSASTFTGFSPVLESVNTCFKASDLSVLTYYNRRLKFFSL